MDKKQENRKNYQHNMRYKNAFKQQLNKGSCIKTQCESKDNDDKYNRIGMKRGDNEMNMSKQKMKNITITPQRNDSKSPVKIMKSDLNHNSSYKSHNDSHNAYGNNQRSLRKTRDNMHFFKTKIDYKTGMVLKAQKELELFRKKSIDHDEEKIKKKKMILNLHKIDYLQMTVSTEENKTNEKQSIKNTSTSQRQVFEKKPSKVKIDHRLSSSQNSSVLMNSRDYKDNVRRNQRKASFKEKIDFFEYVRKINPKFSLKPKNKNNTEIIQTASPLKLKEYPSMILRQSMQKNNNKTKEKKRMTDTKHLKIMLSLNKIDDYIKKNLFNSIHQSNVKKLNQAINRSDSIETIVSSNDLKDQIKTCQTILFSNNNNKQVLMHQT